MKGFNIAPTPAPGMPLAPVAEFIASLQAEPEIPQHQELFGSSISGIKVFFLQIISNFFEIIT